MIFRLGVTALRPVQSVCWPANEAARHIGLQAKVSVQLGGPCSDLNAHSKRALEAMSRIGNGLGNLGPGTIRSSRRVPHLELAACNSRE